MKRYKFSEVRRPFGGGEMPPSRPVDPNSHFKIGDRIRILNAGSCYTTYIEMAEILKLDNYIVGRCDELYQAMKDKSVFKILGSYQHTKKEKSEILLGIESLETKNQFLIHEDGVEKV